MTNLDRKSCELLRSVVRMAPKTPTQQIQVLAEGIRNWDSVLDLAKEHGVSQLLFAHLEKIENHVPHSALEHLRKENSRNIFHSLTNSAELISVLQELTRENIPAMPFKGVVLGASVYSTPAIRPAGDLDILIYYRDLVRATAILVKRGYELKTSANPDGSPAVSDYYEYHFERETDGMVIELRWRLELTQPRFRRDLGMDWVWPGRRTVNLAGAEVPDMDPAIALLVLCMHGSKHVWTRLIWISDVAQQIAAFPDLNWKMVTREAKRVGLWRALALGVLLAQRIADAPVPHDTLHRFEADATARKLARHIDEHLFDAPGSTPKSRVPYNLQLLGPQDRLRLIFSPAFLRPNDRDRASINLPKPLHPLYFLIRPFRLLRDKSSR
jgi:hypothetical protein